mmetsp:Transcript_22115/g.67935  ORF Transcript_22115/g.67935 Transcript_22115/m.67935 type:complete len:323 (-) Transcript_22115:803-1771(-)
MGGQGCNVRRRRPRWERVLQLVLCSAGLLTAQESSYEAFDSWGENRLRCPAHGEYGVVLLHVRKAGGRTMEATFHAVRRREEYVPLSQAERSSNHTFVGFFGSHDSYAALARGLGCEIGADGIARRCRRDAEKPGCLAWTLMLRDPIQRMASAFEASVGRKFGGHFRCSKSSAAYAVLKRNTSTLADWVNLPEEDRARCHVDDAHVNILAGEVRDPQERLELAKRRLMGMDWFGLLEDLPRSYQLLRHQLRTDLVRTTPVYNRNPRNATLPPLVRDVLAAHNALDLELYAFARRVFDERVARLGTTAEPSLSCDGEVICWDR